jgi:hypothetical protein
VGVGLRVSHKISGARISGRISSDKIPDTRCECPDGPETERAAVTDRRSHCDAPLPNQKAQLR